MEINLKLLTNLFFLKKIQIMIILEVSFLSDTSSCLMIDEALATPYVDKTVRPQFIKDDCLDMYKVLPEYKNITELSSIVTTSFNMHEESILSSELDTINSFIKSGIKCMVLGNYLVQNVSEKRH